MPLMLKKEDIFDWIRPNSSLSGIAERAVTNVIMEEAAV